MLKAFMKSKKGFTLVELMVVVVIIGILTAIAVPVYNSVTERAERSAVEANLRTLDGAIMQYYASGNTTALTAVSQLVPTFLTEEPKGPSGASYEIVGSGTEQYSVVTGTVGGKTLSAERLSSTMWD